MASPGKVLVTEPTNCLIPEVWPLANDLLNFPPDYSDKSAAHGRSHRALVATVAQREEEGVNGVQEVVQDPLSGPGAVAGLS